MFKETVCSNVPNFPVRFYTSNVVTTPCLGSEPHLHDEIELLYVISGRFTARNNDIEITATEGEVIFINTRVIHSTYFEEAGSFISFLQFDISSTTQPTTKNASKYYRQFLSHSECSMYHFKKGNPATEELSQCFIDIAREYAFKEKAYDMYISASVYKISAILHRCSVVTDEACVFENSSVERIYPALNYIDTNYKNDITLEELSNQVNLNPHYFCRLFKKCTDSTFTEYLNFVRVHKAEKLLLADKYTISEISALVGFSSVSYFNRIFKRFKGCTPTSYKKVKYAVK